MGGTSYATFTSAGGGGGGGGTAPKARSVGISSGASTAAVTFGTPFVSVPVVVAWLTSSNATADIISIQGYTVSTAGFSVELATQTNDATYTLNWIASAVNDS